MAFAPCLAAGDARIEPVERPDHVGQRAVDERHPEQHEQAERPEADPLGDRPADQRRRDDREHPLEHDVHVDGDVVARQLRGRFDALQEDEVPTPADESAAFAASRTAARASGIFTRWPNARAVADGDPVNADDGERRHALHHGGEDVLAPDHAAVEEGQPRHHEQDERAGGQHPGRVAAFLAGRGCRAASLPAFSADFLISSAFFSSAASLLSAGLASGAGRARLALRHRIDLGPQFRDGPLQIVHFLGVHDPAWRRRRSSFLGLGCLCRRQTRKQSRAEEEKRDQERPTRTHQVTSE